MAEGRLGRFVGGLGLGYLHTLVVLVVGLWLTPFLLPQLGRTTTASGCSPRRCSSISR